MAKKFIIVLVLIVLIIIIAGFYFAFQYFYLTPIKTKAEISFDKEQKIITFSFPYPVLKNYFLRNLEIIPETEGEFVFKNYDPLISVFDNYPKLQNKFSNFSKEIQFVPRKIERDKIYEVIVFQEEFIFSLPSPKIKDIVFDEEEKRVEIVFFDLIEEDYFFEKIQLDPEITGEYVFLDSNTRVIFIPDKIQEDKNYKVAILGKELDFKIESPKVKQLYFDNKREEVIVTFTKPIERERFFENFKITPFLKGKYVFDDSGTKVVFKPDKIQEGKNYKVEILGNKLGFKIDPPLEPALQSILNNSGKLIDVDLSEQKLRLYQNGEIIAEYPASTGKSGMSTPTGNFQILSKEENHWSSKYGLYMPYALNFYGDYYIHELPYWPSGYREGEEHLGTPVSHGCVRVGVGAAETVYNFAEIGTKVVIHQ